MTYEDMTLTQLKALSKERNLGTGRSKKDLIAKLEADDARLREVPDEVDNSTELEIGHKPEEGEPVAVEPDPEPAPAPEVESEPEVTTEAPKVFRIRYSHVGTLLESEHRHFQGRTLDYAKSEGLVPKSGPDSVRLVESKGSRLTYEIEIQP